MMSDFALSCVPMTTTTTRTATLQAELATLAREIRDTDNRAKSLMARRNRLWLKCAKAGMLPEEIVRPFALEAQSCRLVLRNLGQGQRVRAAQKRNGTR